ncbi:MAG: hypothetical protein QOE82_1933 [Thermoanaerobaculia bacterium]|jgi:hypothetical protein|nr:hypothetical protein [Thermoanaerobaculia bacterium]
MPDSRWNDVLWKLIDALSLRRATARVALSAGLLGLAAQSAPDAGAQPRVPVMPALSTEVTVRRFKGKHVLRRAAESFFVRLAQHRSHSSHSSHASHASHSSSSHYSGSHFSSSAPVPRAPATPQPEPQPQPKPRHKVLEEPPPLLREDFDSPQRAPERWSVGVLATPAATFDASAAIEQKGGGLTITPLPHRHGSHFTGYVSIPTFDLSTCTIATELRHPASGGATTIFAAVIDAANWIGFRIEGTRLSIESHTAGKVAARSVGFDPALHRFLRLRMSSVAPVVVWETSADGANWNPEYVETASIPLTSLRIALSAGTTRPIESATPARFDSVTVERKP